MSYILDALSKSQRERQRQAVPSLTTDYSLGPVSMSGGRPWPMLGLASVLAIGIVAAYALMRGWPPLESPAQSAIAAAPAAADTDGPVASVAPPPASARTPSALPVEEVVAVASAKRPPKNVGNVPLETGAAPAAADPPPSMPSRGAAATEPGERRALASHEEADRPPETSATPPLTISPETLRLRDELLALRREAGPADRSSRSSRTAPTTGAAPAAPEREPEAPTAVPDADQAEAIPRAIPAATGTGSARGGDLPTLAALPSDTRAALEPLTVNAHAYDRNPERRMIIVNMKRYREGNRMREGPMVEAITPDGAVLVYGQRRFELPAR